ncbi:MAG: zinc transport system substrate-binding protein [Actinomycetota bacterium]|nr:zinc transport system substrate-binding protein [Actinomycetota bacterium]
MPDVWRTRGALGLVTLAALLAGCGGGGGTGGGGGRVSVVASFYPLVDATRGVGGDTVAVTNLTPVGVEPHDIELNPRQIDRITAADLLLYLGGGFQPAVEDARRVARKAVDLRAGLPEAVPGDAHVWLDPVLFKEVVTEIEAALVEVDPTGAAGDHVRAGDYRQRLDQLDADYRAGLADCDRRLLVTNHEAFGYLARRYGLEQVAISGLAPDAEPDPRHLAELADLVRSRGVTTIFTEELVSPKVGETLAREAGVKTAVLNTIEGVANEDEQDYFSLMRANLATLRTALGCR